ncbi:polymerase (DNA-directed), delta interacting protein 2, isoform CRA_b [Mus musculus]|nr:polymerase (DNA-directed), delta interacting protein 2, isoform CRA_b [Mus musculus]
MMTAGRSMLSQGWTMSAMKTSSPTPPRIRFPFNTSSLKDFFCMTRQKHLLLWLEKRCGPGKRRITRG